MMSLRAKTSITVFVVTAFMAGVLFTTAGANLLGFGEHVATPSHADPVRVAGSNAISSALTLEDAFIEVAEQINPTVVQIRAETVRRRPANPLGEFFGMPDGGAEGEEFRSQGLGSGVFVRAEGYIATNYHVIEGAEDLEVRTSDGRFFDAEVIGEDPGSDLAIIKIDAPEVMPYVSFSDIETVRVGQWVMAFGSPLSQDLGNTVTSGIVSGLGRTSNSISQTLNTFAAFIQTDAAINPGNSGGPLINLRGELVGLNSAILSRSGGSQGIGFSIPVDVVQNVTDQLIDGGAVVRGYLGVNFGGISTALAEALGVPRGAAQISTVWPDTPAADAGLEEGDVVTAIDGITLLDANQLRTTVSNMRPGESVRMSVQRGETTRSITVTLGTRPDDLAGMSPSRDEPEPDAGMTEKLGLSIGDLTPTVIQRLGLSLPNDGTTPKGALVVRIDANSLAYREADLRRGDLITEVDRQEVDGVDAFGSVYEQIAPGQTFLVRVERFGQAGSSTSFITALTKPE